MNSALPFSQGPSETCTSILRDAYYIFAAEHFGLPYWPSSFRIELSRAFPNFFDTAMRLQLYRRMADAFKASVEEVFEDADEQIVHIPPFATLVLERCNSAADLARELLAVREEYAPLRAGFARLEEERRSALTIKERIRARRHQKLLFEDLARRFENPAQVKLEGVVRYVPDPTEPGARPASPSGYTARLVTMPLESIARWWRRRPISKLFELKSRLERVRSYEHLVRKVLGKEINIRALGLAEMSSTAGQSWRSDSGEGLSVLVIDDDPRRALLLKGLSMGLTNRVLVAGDFDSALAITRTELPALTVVSGSMSRADDLLSILKDDLVTLKIPVIVVLGDAERRAHFMAAGADAVLLFPFQPTTFRKECIRLVEAAGRLTARGAR